MPKSVPLHGLPVLTRPRRRPLPSTRVVVCICSRVLQASDIVDVNEVVGVMDELQIATELVEYMCDRLVASEMCGADFVRMMVDIGMTNADAILVREKLRIKAPVPAPAVSGAPPRASLAVSLGAAGGPAYAAVGWGRSRDATTASDSKGARA